MLNDKYLQTVVGEFQDSSNPEQRIIAVLHARGDMVDLTCDEQRNTEIKVRNLLLEAEEDERNEARDRMQDAIDEAFDNQFFNE